MGIMACMVAAFTSFIPTASAQMSFGGGTRIDYINAKGERFWSTSPYPGNIYFSVNGDKSSGFSVKCPQTVDEKSTPEQIRFVQPDGMSYPLTVRSQNDDVTISYNIVGESSTQTGDIPSGAEIKLTVTAPSGSFPTIACHLAYSWTYPNGETNTWELSSLGLEALSQYSVERDHEQGEYRKNYIDAIENPYVWKRDMYETDKWYFSFYMPNEPLDITASAVRPDYVLLRNAADMALSELYRQHKDMNLYSGNNGEGSIMSYVGNDLSQDFVSELTQKGLSMNYLYYANLMYTALPWTNSSSYINHANLILRYLDQFTAATEEERNTVRGQMYVLRSLGYLRLMQCYGPRWSDRNRSRLVAPLYTTYSAQDLPLASMEEIYAQCRMDLIEAEKMLPEKSDTFNEPDKNAARGIRLRFEMLAENWTEVTQLAESILKEKPLTTDEDLKSGFFEPAESWIWGADGTLFGKNNLFYWSWNAINACNGAYPAAWQMGAGAIEKDLYLSIPESDVRRALYVMPDRFEADMQPYDEMAGWYDSSNIDINNLAVSKKQTGFINHYKKLKPEGVINSAFTCGYGDNVPIQFGAQVKFYAPDAKSYEGALLFMRSDEVYLSAAEAYANLGDVSKAAELINRFNTMRNPSGNLLSQDDDILAEIHKARRIELWGEGHSWFDLKRWSQPMRCRHWVENDTESGNWYPTVIQYLDTDFANGWRFPIPEYITVWNPYIDVNKLDYEEVYGYTEEPWPAPRKAAVTIPSSGMMPTAPVKQEMLSAPSDFLKTVED